MGAEADGAGIRRESLIRLIGKRRRLLPNRRRIGSSPTQSLLNLHNDRNSEAGAAGSVELKLGGSDACEGERGGGSECGIDTCLPRGTKRKLTQRTLLQFNFSANANHSSKEACARKGSSPTSPEDDVVCKIDPNLASCSMVDETESFASGSLSDYGGKECRFLRPYGIGSTLQNDRDDYSEEHNVP
ncbi:Fanconi-associated nuclease 1-like protein [Drosera capensis]